MKKQGVTAACSTAEGVQGCTTRSPNEYSEKQSQTLLYSSLGTCTNSQLSDQILFVRDK